MMFCGTTFCGEAHTLDGTPTNVNNINKLTLKNTVYDNLFVTNKIVNDWNGEQAYDWDYDTVMCAKFNGNLHAGNTDYNSDTVDKLKIKRRKIGDYEYITLFEVPIYSNSDLSFNRFDNLAASSQDYEYALVPCLGGVEGTYNINNVRSDFDGVFLVERDKTFQAILNMELSHKRVKNGSSITTLGRRCPFHISNGASNYTRGTLSATYIPYNNGVYDVENGWKYRELFNDFITDGKPKILKDFEGKMWIIYAEEETISESQKDHYQNIVTSFDWFEVGDANSAYDLYVNGFIDEKPSNYSSPYYPAINIVDDDYIIDRIDDINVKVRLLKRQLNDTYKHIPNEIAFNDDSRKLSLLNNGAVIDDSVIPDDVVWKGDGEYDYEYDDAYERDS